MEWKLIEGEVKYILSMLLRFSASGVLTFELTLIRFYIILYSSHYISTQTCSELLKSVTWFISFHQQLCFLIYIIMFFFSPCISIHFFILGYLSKAAIIKYEVFGGAGSSSRAEEKDSNSSSQDETVTHNGPAILSALP